MSASSTLTENRPDLDPKRLARTRQLMCDAVPDCRVEGYEPLIDGLELPDPEDRHVLAAAVRANAQVIVTWNLKDFPAEQLDVLGIEAQSPDEFVAHVIDLAPGRVVQAITEMADALEAPPMTFDDVFRRTGRPRPLGVRVGGTRTICEANGSAQSSEPVTA